MKPLVLKYRERIVDRAVRDEFDNLVAGINASDFQVAKGIPYAMAVSPAIQAVATATPTRFTLAPLDDPYNLVSPFDITVPQAGWYSILGTVWWVESAAGTYRQALIYKNNVLFDADGRATAGAGSATVCKVPFEYRLRKNDKMSLWGQHDTGGNLNSGALASTLTNSLILRYVRP